MDGKGREDSRGQGIGHRGQLPPANPLAPLMSPNLAGDLLEIFQRETLPEARRQPSPRTST